MDEKNYIITYEDTKAYIIVNGEKHELDQGEMFEPDIILKWIELTKKLSNRKQKMRIPSTSAIRAVGLECNNIDTFLNNESKFGLVAYLRKKDWYVNRHPEIKTAILKLFAHLGLFEDKMKLRREEIINKLIDNFTMLEIHNIFGGLIPGTNLTDILMEYDKIQGVDQALRKKYDPTGMKGIDFFISNIDNEEFKEIAFYSLTHYVYEVAKLERLRQNYVAQIEAAASKMDDENIKCIADSINKIHDEINQYINLYKNPKCDRTKELQDKMEEARKKLYYHIKLSNYDDLKKLVDKLMELPHTLTIDFIKESLKKPKLDIVEDLELRELMIDAGYTDGDEIEINTLLKIIKCSKTAPIKYFVPNVIDKTENEYKYLWLFPQNPLLYTIAMKCGGTCMRPGFAGEAALWEAALSPDVMICAIINKQNQPFGYMRVNYDNKNHGIYVDTIESRKEIVRDNEEVWLTFKRALIDMAEAMNNYKMYPVDIINYRDDLGNQLKKQFNNLTDSTINLNARPYFYKEAPWSYGDYESRNQRKIWERSLTKMSNIKDQLSKENEISRGATGIVYEINDSQVIKVYPDNYDINKIKEELYKMNLFNDLGIRCPRAYEITTIDNKIGIVMEKINGETLTKHIALNPSSACECIKRMVNVMKKIHAIDASGFNVQSIKDKYMDSLIKCSSYYEDKEFLKLKELLEFIPDDNTLLHGDFHTGNIILDENNELVVIDFLELGYGHPIFDIMAQGAVIPVTIENDINLAESYHQMSANVLNLIWKRFVIESFGEKMQEEIDNYSKDAILYSRIRNAITKDIASNIPEEYLQLCADKTKEILLPEVDRLVEKDKILVKLR